MATLRHVFATLHRNFLDLPEELGTLNTMYRVNDKIIQDMKAPSPNTDDDSEADSDGVGGGSDEELSRNNSPDRTNLRSRPRHSRRLEKKEYAAGRGTQKREWNREDILVMLAPSREPMAIMQEELFAQSIPRKPVNADESENADWEFGPRGTAQDAIAVFTFFNGGGYKDNGPWAKPVVKKTKWDSQNEQGLLSPKMSGESMS